MAAEPRIETPSAADVEAGLPSGGSLTGREIYDRFLKNRRKLRTVLQNARILSKDPGGNPQQTRFVLRAKDYRDANEDPVDGIYAKTIITITGPYDIRKKGYLHIHHSDRADEQYMYSPSRRRVIRVSLKGQTLAGTDFSFDDFLVSAHDIEDADYTRRDDETVADTPCYVVEAVMKPDAKSRYTRLVTYVEKEHYVPLRTRYWEDGVAMKEMEAPAGKIKEFDGAWVAMESTMTDLLEGTQSTLYVDELDPNPNLTDHDFTVARLVEHPS
jgi:hypothetical protein